MSSSSSASASASPTSEDSMKNYFQKQFEEMRMQFTKDKEEMRIQSTKDQKENKDRFDKLTTEHEKLNTDFTGYKKETLQAQGHFRTEYEKLNTDFTGYKKETQSKFKEMEQDLYTLAKWCYITRDVYGAQDDANMIRTLISEGELLELISVHFFEVVIATHPKVNHCRDELWKGRNKSKRGELRGVNALTIFKKKDYERENTTGDLSYDTVEKVKPFFKENKLPRHNVGHMITDPLCDIVFKGIKKCFINILSVILLATPMSLA